MRRCLLVALIFCSATSGRTDTARKEALDVRISLAQRAFHLGEPIQLRLEISNIGHEPLLVPNSVSLFGNSDSFLEIELRSRKGLVSHRMGMALDCFPTPNKNKRPPSEIVLTSFLLLRPGTSYVQNIPLYEHLRAPEYAIKPGSYTLRTYYASNGLFYPSMCGTLTTQGLTEEDVPSIRPEILGKDREGYRIALHNLSSRAITAFVVETTFDHNSQYSEHGGRDPLIAKGGSHEFRLFCDTSDLGSSNGSVPRPAPCAFILKAALFADGSYEGDASAAAVLAGPSIASQFQRRRVRGLIDNILADASLDDASRLSRIRSELPKLSGEQTPEILEQIRIRFPGLTPTALDRVNADIRVGFASEEKNVLRVLKDFEQLPNQSPHNRSLAQWLEDYEK